MALPWIVLKFGGTSVSSAASWAEIARIVRGHAPAHRVWIVASALTGVSDRLEAAVDEALAGDTRTSLRWLEDKHRALAGELGLTREATEPVERLLAEVAQLLDGVRLTGESSPRLRARLASFGELASTRLGEAALRALGIDLAWVDARELLESRQRLHEAESSRYLDAEVSTRTDPSRAESIAGGSAVVLTQGYIARTPRGETCLLGRGGSDTSGALFAALLDSAVLEIWTDVHGLFTADPRHTPTARLIRRIGYREAQELAAMGAKVLHPRCLGPAESAGIPIRLRNTFDPAADGTLIAAPRGEEEAPSVMAVVRRKGVTLLSLSTVEMYGTAGFLARTFAPFEEAGVSVDLVATSQSTVTVTLDRIPGGVSGETFERLVRRLEGLGRVEVVHPCAVVSIVGRRIRTVLHELGPALAAFRERAVHLVSESSDDLNLSFAVDEEDADALVQQLHTRLIPAAVEEPRFGPSFEVLARRGGSGDAPEPGAMRWWGRRRSELLDLSADGEPLFAYDLATIEERARALRAGLPSVARFFYAVKANSHPRVLEVLAAAGFGMECVSPGEIARVREVLGPSAPVLFTPNFCAFPEYAFAMSQGAFVTVDGPQALEADPPTFGGREVFARVDPGRGLGHDPKVRTAGGRSKFGQPLGEMDLVAEAADRVGARVIGLHAHVGSGILDPEAWARTATTLAGLRPRFPHLRVLNVGGGLGVVQRPGQSPLDLAVVDARLAPISGAGGLELWLEPGRYLVSDAGVLLATVTQARTRSGVRFVGVATGMNSLIRPALYGAWHGIHNLTRHGDAATGYAHVVGPICESADVLGHERLLPECSPGDVMLIENCGAYGAVMSSRYNLRNPAAEVVLEKKEG
jgi:diaminopimelate decarboxylase/aspartate kinase